MNPGEPGRNPVKPGDFFPLSSLYGGEEGARASGERSESSEAKFMHCSSPGVTE